MRRILALALAGGLAAAGTAVVAERPALPEGATSFLSIPGYLPAGATPDSRLLNPPPPAPGSSAEKRDQEASAAGLALQGSPRWELAIGDADIFSPRAAAGFSCAAGVPIGPDTTPKLAQLMRRASRDLAVSTSPTKHKYMRARPFTVNGQPMCTPDHEAILRADGSYPSGHSAIGYGWGLILAQVIPDRAAELVARGRAFGDSRRICNVHWLSDVEEGRVAAAAVFARLNAEPAFQADVAAARAEVAALADKTPKQDCQAEAAALAF